MRRVDIAVDALVETIDGTVKLSPEEAVAKKRSTSREASRLVADYAEDPEEAEEASSEVIPSALKRTMASDLPPIETKLPDWTQNAATFTGIVAKTASTKGTQLLLYPYGIDEPVALDLKGDTDDQYGDGLISFEEGRLWPEIKREDEEPQSRNEPIFKNRRAFKWKVCGHRLLNTVVPMPDGAVYTEQVLTRDIVEMYALKRGLDSTAIVISEWEQCWLLAEFAESGLPDPPTVFSRKGKARNHVTMMNYIAFCKFYIYKHEDITDQDWNRTVARVESIKRSKADDSPFQDKLSSMKAMSVMESADLQGWMTELGMSAPNMVTLDATSMRSSLTA
jgi:hypothetical protein